MDNGSRGAGQCFAPFMYLRFFMALKAKLFVKFFARPSLTTCFYTAGHRGSGREGGGNIHTGMELKKGRGDTHEVYLLSRAYHVMRSEIMG